MKHCSAERGALALTYILRSVYGMGVLLFKTNDIADDVVDS